MKRQDLLRFVSACCCVVILAMACVVLGSCGRRVEPAGMVLLNGKIVTMDDHLPEVEALAIYGDTIAAVGSTKELQRYIGAQTRVIDLDGKLAVPGFIDGHGHFLSLGRSKARLALATAKNWDEIVEMVRVAAREAAPGEWILGRGWHQEKWDQTPKPNVAGLPFHQALSEVSPHNPVLLDHASGHATIANAKAMNLAGITRATPDPPGGEIVRGPDGDPIGVFRETAQEPLEEALREFQNQRTPEQTQSEKQRAIQLAVEECLSKGITSFQDAGSTFKTIDTFKDLAEQGKLGVRLWVMILEDLDSLRQHLAEYKIVGIGENHLTVRAIKRIMDGALGSHGAWLLEPYADLPASSGLNTTPITEMQETAQLAMEHGFQLCTHAIGDRANRETLDIYEQAFNTYPETSDPRWRIEHAQHLHPDDVPRFGELGIIASMQPCHSTSDGPWVPKRLGKQRSRNGAYVWRKLIDSGALVTSGTDTPVEDVDPLANFYAAVTRKLADGSVFFPDQRMTREEALRAYTRNCAFAAFEEDIKGSISVGKLADIVILSHDIMTIPEDEILNTNVLYTIVGGRIVYQRDPEAI